MISNILLNSIHGKPLVKFYYSQSKNKRNLNTEQNIQLNNEMSDINEKDIYLSN